MSLREKLDRVIDKRGELTPQIVVDEARPVDSELHGELEWDDTIGGEKYRLVQAHRLIQSVRIPYIGKRGPKDLRAYVAVPRPSSSQPSYERIEEVLADPHKRRIVLDQMEREWKSMRGRYGDFVEFAEMVQASFA